MAKERKTFGQLFVPIYAETLFMMMAGMADTLMLSALGDGPVGAVGTVNTYLSMFILMFNVVSTGVMSVMTQNIGAGRCGTARQTRNLGLTANMILGCSISLFMLFFSRPFLVAVGIAAELEETASTYFVIVGGTCFLNALIPVFSGYLRAFGYTRQSLWAAVAANVVNVGLNALFLFPMGWGVAGVAWATAISKAVNLILVAVFAWALVRIGPAEDRGDPGRIMKQILRIGLPSAVENMMYNFALTFAISLLNRMDSTGFQVAARAYTAQIANFSISACAALGQANAILVGWRIGQGDLEACSAGTWRAWRIGLAVSSVIAAAVALSAPVLVGFFSDDPEMVRVVTRLLWIDVVLELGRSGNVIFGNALKTSGDAVFPVLLGLVFMFLCTACGTWLLGVKLELMVTGFYIALASDECCRAVGMGLRWRSGKWKGKGLV